MQQQRYNSTVIAEWEPYVYQLYETPKNCSIRSFLVDKIGSDIIPKLRTSLETGDYKLFEYCRTGLFVLHYVSNFINCEHATNEEIAKVIKNLDDDNIISSEEYIIANKGTDTIIDTLIKQYKLMNKKTEEVPKIHFIVPSLEITSPNQDSINNANIIVVDKTTIQKKEDDDILNEHECKEALKDMMIHEDDIKRQPPILTTSTPSSILPMIVGGGQKTKRRKINRKKRRSSQKKSKSTKKHQKRKYSQTKKLLSKRRR